MLCSTEFPTPHPHAVNVLQCVSLGVGPQVANMLSHFGAPPCRLYIIFFSDELGGQAAADTVSEILVEVIRYRKIGPPCSVEDLLGNLPKHGDRQVA